jgi:hypothetical protein
LDIATEKRECGSNLSLDFTLCKPENSTWLTFSQPHIVTCKGCGCGLETLPLVVTLLDKREGCGRIHLQMTATRMKGGNKGHSHREVASGSDMKVDAFPLLLKWEPWKSGSTTISHKLKCSTRGSKLLQEWASCQATLRMRPSPTWVR